MLGTIGAQQSSLASAVGQLPDFMRQFDTTAVNLRAALDDVQPLINATRPVARLVDTDGWDVHRTRSAFDDDRARANALVLAGWIVLRFTSRSTVEDVVDAIRAAFVQRLAA